MLWCATEITEFLPTGYNTRALGKYPISQGPHLVRMPLVHHHVAQVAQEPCEVVVHGQDAHVQHVRVGDEQLSGVPDLSTLMLWGVPVIHLRRCTEL